jgi:hypothetical protein
VNYGNTITNITYGDAETRGKLRAWKKVLAHRYAVFDNAYRSQTTKHAICDMVRGSTSTRTAAYLKLVKAFGPGAVNEGITLDRGKALGVWSILKPRNAVIAVASEATSESERASLAQDCVTVNYIVAGSHRILLGEGLWSLEVPDHALGRAVERSRFLHPETIIREAHVNLLGLSVDHAKTLEYLKAGPGCFAGTLAFGTDVQVGLSLHFRVSTWLADDMLGPDQIPMCEPGEAGKRLGDSVLLPRPLWPSNDYP